MTSPDLLEAMHLITAEAWWSESDTPSPANMEAKLHRILYIARAAVAKEKEAGIAAIAKAEKGAE